MSRFRSVLLTSPSYKSFLLQLVERPGFGKGLQSKLAEAAACQRSYLSKVLHADAHLLPDHALGISEFLGLEEVESDYFLELLQLGRAGSPKLQERQRKKLERLKRQMENLQNRFQSDKLSEEEQQKVYYSSWLYSALHMASGIPKFSTAEALAKRFHLELSLVNSLLQELSRMNLVEAKNGQLQRKSTLVHVPFGSPMNAMNHANWSIQALADIQKNTEESLHYTAVYSLAKEDAEQVKHILLKAIESTREIVIPSKDEELVCMRLDLFRV